MEQAQHFDSMISLNNITFDLIKNYIFQNLVASLLTCLYQLKSENVGLEDELSTYTRRRDHLLAVNARLAIPLPPQSNLFLLLFFFFIIWKLQMVYWFNKFIFIITLICILYILVNRHRAPTPITNNHTSTPTPSQPPRSNHQPNHGNIDSSLQHRYQNHQIPNRYYMTYLKYIHYNFSVWHNIF